MTQDLEFTGERFTPECLREIWYEHFHRYACIRPWVKHKKVLDAACGEGYGSKLLADSAEEVVGVDVDAATVAHASERYAGVSGLRFEQGDCTRLPFDDHAFDVVVSFETLEHLQQQDEMLMEFRRVLKPDGFLLISSPDKHSYSELTGFDNPYHVKELYRDEFEALVGSHFPAFKLLGQKLIFQSAIWDLEDIQSVSLSVQTESGETRETRQLPYPPIYYLAVAAASEDALPSVSGGLWLFGDAAESVYQHYNHEIRKNMSAGKLLQARDAEIERLRGRLEARSPSLWQRIKSWLGK